MWDLIVSVPDLCLFFYFDCGIPWKSYVDILQKKGETLYKVYY